MSSPCLPPERFSVVTKAWKSKVQFYPSAGKFGASYFNRIFCTRFLIPHLPELGLVPVCSYTQHMGKSLALALSKYCGTLLQYFASLVFDKETDVSIAIQQSLSCTLQQIFRTSN